MVQAPQLSHPVLSGLVACWSAVFAAPPIDAGSLHAAAEAGDAYAQLNLGAAYDHGLSGVPVDPVRAVAWYRRAALAGVAEAQFNLAHCLATGHGVATDEVEAFVWMQRAAAAGKSEAVEALRQLGSPDSPQ